MSEAKKSGDEYPIEITSLLITSTKRCLGPEYMPDLKGNKLLMKTQEFIECDEHWWYTDKLTRFVEEISAELVKET